MKITAVQMMTRDVKTAVADWPVDRLLEFFTDNAISGAPVVSDDDTPIGVVSLTDVARAGMAGGPSSAADVPAYYQEGLERFVDPDEMESFQVDHGSGVTVRDIMTPMVFSVQEHATVQEIAEVMITGRIHRVLVTREGKMVGIITSMDLLPLVRDLGVS